MIGALGGFLLEHRSPITTNCPSPTDADRNNPHTPRVERAADKNSPA